MRLLVAEDERDLNRLLQKVLTKAGYTVDGCYDGEEALLYLQGTAYDALVLDVMMPRKDGYTLVQEMRSQGMDTPVLFLTARDSVADRVKGLDLGADDYLPKPFSMELLLARVRAMLRRREEFTPNVLRRGSITLNQQTYELSGGGQTFVLPKLEYRLMELLMLNKDVYLSSEELLIKVWGYDTEAELGTVWVYISYLRKRLAALNADVTIAARRNVGYRLEVAE